MGFVETRACGEHICKCKERAAAASPEGRTEYNELKGPFLAQVKARLKPGQARGLQSITRGLRFRRLRHLFIVVVVTDRLQER